MRMALEWRRHDLFQPVLDRARILARRQAGAVRDAEDMRVDGDGLVAEGDVEHDIRGLAPDAGQFFERFAIVRHKAAVFFEQQLRQRDHVFGLGAVKADGPDEFAQPRFAQRDHLFGIVGEPEQGLGRLVDADIGRLGGQHHRHQQRVRIDVFELGGGVRARLRQNGEKTGSGIRAHAFHACD